MGENQTVSFGDFIQGETECIRSLSNTIQKQFSEQRYRHFTDALGTYENNIETDQMSDHLSEQLDEIDIHPSDEHIIDEDLNSSINNNSKNKVDRRNEPERYHSIPQVTVDEINKPLVIPETPKEQRVKKKKSVTLKDYNFVQTSRSEGNVPLENIRVSISESSRSRLTTATETSMWGLRLDPSNSDEDMTVLENQFRFSSPDYATREPIAGASTQASGTNIRRFDKNVQTSNPCINNSSNANEQTVNSMRDFGRFLDSMLLGIRHSNFNVARDKQPRNTLSNYRMFPLQEQRPNQRLDVRIYNLAVSCCRTLQTIQMKKVQLELRIAFNEKLLSTDHFPPWSVTFNPPMNLLTSGRAIESTVGFRYEQSKTFIRMVNDLMREESNRLTNEVQATMASLECHYQEEAAHEYNIQEALDALQTLMIRAKNKEETELSNRYDQIHQAPLAALWEIKAGEDVLQDKLYRQ